MPTIQESPGDVLFFSTLVATPTVYTGYRAAFDAATAASAAASNAPIFVARIQEIVDALGGTGGPQVDMPGIGIPRYIIVLTLTGATNKQAARTAAYALSAANSNAPVYLVAVVNTVTAP